MATRAWHDAWRDVDSTSDPSFFVRFLDETRIGNLKMIQADPKAYFAFLEPEPGMSVLDVGTGTGVLLHALAGLVGQSGRVVGVDASKAMIDAALRRAPAGLPLDFRVGDAYAMEFEDDVFDAAMSNIVFQHLPEPHRPLQEMVRVTKPGGRVVLSEQDWDTFFFDCGEKDLTRRIVHAFCDMVPNGNIGRELPRLFAEAGLERIAVQGIPVVLHGPAARMFDGMIADHVAHCQDDGLITAKEREEWLGSYRERSEAGTMTAGFTLIRATGFKSAG